MLLILCFLDYFLLKKYPQRPIRALKLDENDWNSTEPSEIRPKCLKLEWDVPWLNCRFNNRPVPNACMLTSLLIFQWHPSTLLQMSSSSLAALTANPWTCWRCKQGHTDEKFQHDQHYNNRTIMQGNTELKRGVLQKTRMLQCQDARSLVSSSQNLLPTNSSLLPLPPPSPSFTLWRTGKDQEHGWYKNWCTRGIFSLRSRKMHKKFKNWACFFVP